MYTSKPNLGLFPYVLAAFLIASFMALIAYLTLPYWNLGMAAQIWPAYTSQTYGFRAPQVNEVPLPSLHPTCGFILSNPDGWTYMQGLENMNNCRKSDTKKNCIKEICHSERLPGYLVWYGLIAGALKIMAPHHKMSEYKIAKWLILLQIAFGIASSVLFAVIVYDMTGVRTLIPISSFIYSSFPFIFRYNFIYGSEGFYHFFVVASVFFLHRSPTKHPLWALGLGLMTIEAILLRPITIVLIIPYAIYIVMQHKNLLLYRLSLFLAPFVAFESFWIPCKMDETKNFYLFTSVGYTNLYESECGAVLRFMTSFGDNYYEFYYAGYQIPKRAYTERFNQNEADSILRMETAYYQGKIEEKTISKFLNSWADDIKREKPFLYFFLSRAYSIANFFTSHIREQLLYTKISRCGYEYGIIYIYSVLLWCAWIILGLWASFYYLWRFRRYPFEAAISLSAHLAWTSYAALGWIQSRYFLFALVLFGLLAVRFGYYLLIRALQRLCCINPVCGRWRASSRCLLL